MAATMFPVLSTSARMTCVIICEVNSDIALKSACFGLKAVNTCSSLHRNNGRPFRSDVKFMADTTQHHRQMAYSKPKLKDQFP